MGQKEIEKEAIIAEYLVGETTYRKLESKYGIDFRVIHSWVMKYQGKNQKPSIVAKPKEVEETALPTDVKRLQAELRKAQLHNKLLNAMIDIAEDQLKIDIRKKSGTKR
jgi:transposase-like protein